VIHSEFHGRRGVGAYLGEFAGHHLFLVSRHVVDEDDFCGRLVNASHPAGGVVMSCSLGIHALKESDVSFVAMKPAVGDFAISMVPVQLGDLPDRGAPLALRSIDALTQTYVEDRSEECLLLDHRPRLMFDLDSLNSIDQASWSLP